MLRWREVSTNYTSICFSFNISHTLENQPRLNACLQSGLGGCDVKMLELSVLSCQEKQKSGNSFKIPSQTTEFLYHKVLFYSDLF